MLAYIAVTVIVWLFILTYIVWTTRAHYNTLIAKTKKGTIGDILSALIQKNEALDQQMTLVKKQVEELLENEKLHYQKIGFLRFNAFERAAGEQSFIIALLNRENTGIVINFLYTREGIRVYAKKVQRGVSEEYELSDEEKETIKKSR